MIKILFLIPKYRIKFHAPFEGIGYKVLNIFSFYTDTDPLGYYTCWILKKLFDKKFSRRKNFGTHPEYFRLKNKNP